MLAAHYGVAGDAAIHSRCRGRLRQLHRCGQTRTWRGRAMSAGMAPPFSSTDLPSKQQPRPSIVVDERVDKAHRCTFAFAGAPGFFSMTRYFARIVFAVIVFACFAAVAAEKPNIIVMGDDAD